MLDKFIKGRDVLDFLYSGELLLRYGKHSLWVCRDLFLEAGQKYRDDTDLAHTCGDAIYDAFDMGYWIYLNISSVNDTREFVVPGVKIANAAWHLVENCGDELKHNITKVVDRILETLSSSGECKGKLSKLILEVQDIVTHFSDMGYITQRLALLFLDGQEFYQKCIPHKTTVVLAQE